MNTAFKPTALRNTCVLTTPSAVINEAFQYAKDNLARCMRYYTLGWGMSNAPHNYTIVVGRDTGWMTIGTDYVAPWFAAEALKVFRDRQKPNGQILEYIDMETDKQADYGLNIADNTPLYIWGVYHHWQQFRDEAFRTEFLPSVRMAGDYLLREIHPNGLQSAVPTGTDVYGISSWRNIIANTVIAGEVTEINAWSAFALRLVTTLTGDQRYREGAERIAAAVNQHLWTGNHYLLTRYQGQTDAQMTGDNIFPLLCGIAQPHQAQQVLARLEQPDFWTPRGMRTVPNTDPKYNPRDFYGLLGGSWPNLTLWYASVVAPYNADRALAALEKVAEPVLMADSSLNTTFTEFPEFFDGDTGTNLGMRLSPWVAPTFIWAVMEGLLGLQWRDGKAQFQPRWPSGWEEISLQNVPSADGPLNVVLRKD